jgi:hypothetical protein
MVSAKAGDARVRAKTPAWRNEMRLHNCELNILVRGRKVSEYTHPDNNDIYIEGRASSAFEIEFINRNDHRVEVVLSVDGLSVTDGKAAGDTSRGYIVDAYGRIAIPGWKIDAAQVAKFEFSGKKGGSYVEQTAAGNSANKGVIGALVYRERPAVAHVWTGNWPNVGQWPRNGSAADVGMQPMWSTVNCAVGGVLRSAGTTTAALSNCAPASINNAVTQTLGTGFGAAYDFATTQTTFHRLLLMGSLEMFYDDKKGLLRRGIDLKPVRAPQSRPQAFPAMGCPIPEGWKG